MTLNDPRIPTLMTKWLIDYYESQDEGWIGEEEEEDDV